MMGCFDQLVLPWKAASDLGEEGPHLAENFRMIDQWANRLQDSCGSAPTPAAAYAELGDVSEIDPVGVWDLLDPGDMTAVNGMEWFNTQGFLVPRDNFYHVTLHLALNDSTDRATGDFLSAQTNTFPNLAQQIMLPPLDAGSTDILFQGMTYVNGGGIVNWNCTYFDATGGTVIWTTDPAYSVVWQSIVELPGSTLFP